MGASRISSRVANRRIAMLRQSQKKKLQAEKQELETLKRKSRSAFEVSSTIVHEGCRQKLLLYLDCLR